MSRWLAHYGIKGQRWGVRQFQNADGTWTELGKRKRRVAYGASKYINDDGSLNEKGYKKYLNSIHSKDEQSLIYGKKIHDVEKRIKDHVGDYEYRLPDKDGYADIDSDILLKKGTRIYRTSGTENENLANRSQTYAGVTKNDAYSYLNYGINGELGYESDYDKDNYFKIYKTKELKIAGLKTLTNAIVDKIGDRPVREYFKEDDALRIDAAMIPAYEKLKDVKIKNIFTDSMLDDYLSDIHRDIQRYSYKYPTNEAISSRAYIGRRLVRNYFNQNVFKSADMNSNLVQDMVKKGYDAVIDMEDSTLQDLPIIIANPKGKISLEGNYKINADDLYYDEGKTVEEKFDEIYKK